MTNDQLAKSKVPILHFPTVLGAVVPVYNLKGAPQELNLTPEALAGIFLGKITRWNDPALVKTNPKAALPAAPIVVVHRSDGSGTTFVWTDYLSKVSAEWKSRVGANTSVSWPVGLGAKGNEGVAGLVRQTPNSIGYVELVYALQNKIPYARVQNAAGVFVRPELKSVTAAAAGVPMPPDFRVSITNSPAKDAYPISSFTWLLVPARISDARKRDAIRDFLGWMLGEGQRLAEPMGYAPLPNNVVEAERKAIAKIQ
jgi:phosphate transport system substrate-binding protein